MVHVKVAGAVATPFDKATTFVAPCGETTRRSTTPEPWVSSAVAYQTPLVQPTEGASVVRRRVGSSSQTSVPAVFF